MIKKPIGIGLMGLGVVGSGVARVLAEKGDTLGHQVGCPLSLKRVLVRDVSKKRSIEVSSSLLTTQAREILDDPEIAIVIEVMGGERPALDLIKEAIKRGKHVVTANKEVIAKHGPSLFALARKHRVELLYEASVGAGIPLIASLRQGLLANEISSIYAIINGTTNYILTQMANHGMDFSLALHQAQKLGYAEADPTADVEGIDAAYKLAILATLAFHKEILPSDVHHEGITRITARDFRYAQELGYAIKLLAIAKREIDSLQVRVHPALVPQDLLLAKVEGVFNAVQVEGDLIGRLLLYGQGAGSLPTTSAVIADAIDLAYRIHRNIPNPPPSLLAEGWSIKPISQIQTRYYLRMAVTDRPGVLAQIAKTLGDHLISIASVIQKEVDEDDQTAEIVIMTHQANEAAMQEALREAARLPVVHEVGNFIRVEG
ncbi:MAG: homoserine dehydrogenase [Chloroflexi bacterium]|nr:homoserine dehydrogenase [Chloroflexota bacterium]